MTAEKPLVCECRVPALIYPNAIAWCPTCGALFLQDGEHGARIQAGQHSTIEALLAVSERVGSASSLLLQWPEQYENDDLIHIISKWVEQAAVMNDDSGGEVMQ